MAEQRRTGYAVRDWSKEVTDVIQEKTPHPPDHMAICVYVLIGFGISHGVSLSSMVTAVIDTYQRAQFNHLKAMRVAEETGKNPPNKG